MGEIRVLGLPLDPLGGDPFSVNASWKTAVRSCVLVGLGDSGDEGQKTFSEWGENSSEHFLLTVQEDLIVCVCVCV